MLSTGERLRACRKALGTIKAQVVCALNEVAMAQKKQRTYLDLQGVSNEWRSLSGVGASIGVPFEGAGTEHANPKRLLWGQLLHPSAVPPPLCFPPCCALQQAVAIHFARHWILDSKATSRMCQVVPLRAFVLWNGP